MKKNSKAIIIILTFLISISSILFFISGIRKLSVPKEFEIVELKAANSANLINSQIDIYANKQGIPHIISANDNDVFFGMGYFHARERLWQICNFKIIAEGRSAEFYGENYFLLDIFMRNLELRKIANDLFENADEETKEILTAFANGFNAFVKQNQHRLSFEFGASNFLPEEFQPSDCFLIQRYWAFLSSSGFFSDILLGEISNKIGTKKAISLFPKYSENSPFILDDSIFYDKKSYNIESDLSSNNESISNDTLLKNYEKIGFSFRNIIEQLNFVKEFVGLNGANSNNNIWASNKFNQTSILANDSHFPSSIPCFWLQTHISSPNYNVVGLTIPGIPIFLCGRNDDISWGTANMRVDDIDFFVQKLDEKQEKYFVNDSITKSVNEFIDTVKIRGKDDFIYYKKAINNRRIITDSLLFLALESRNKNSNNSLNFSKENKIFSIKKKTKANLNLTFQWTGTQKTNEIGSILKVMKSRNWNDFLNSISNWSCPGMVFSFADKNGNIGIAPRAIIPIRAKNLLPFLPSPFWKFEKTWIDFVQPKSLPTLYNPKKKFVFAANNEIIRDFPHYISSNFSSDSRALRIEEMLNLGEKYSYRDAQYMQTDVFSNYAKFQLQKLNYIFKKYEHLLNKVEKKAYYKLANWDFIMSPQSTTTSIYNMFLAKFVHNTFADELGEFYDNYISNTNQLIKKLNDLVENPLSDWFDNIETENREHLEFIVIKSFKDAILELEKLYETSDSDKWNYGNFHQINFSHSYNHFDFVKKATNIGRFQLGGDFTTINQNEWNLNNPFEVISGASMRFIADMSDSAVYTIISGGTSGDPINANYSDQIKLWQIGAYVKLSVNPIPTDDFSLILNIF
jgi:penicillin amidase